MLLMQEYTFCAIDENHELACLQHSWCWIVLLLIKHSLGMCSSFCLVPVLLSSVVLPPQSTWQLWKGVKLFSTATLEKWDERPSWSCFPWSWDLLLLFLCARRAARELTWTRLTIISRTFFRVWTSCWTNSTTRKARCLSSSSYLPP